MKRLLLWTSNIDFADWKDTLSEDYLDKSEEDLMELMYEINREDLEILRKEFDILVPNDILVIGDLGLWNGRKTGYRILKSRSLQECFYGNEDEMTWYLDENGDLRCDAIHHDGTNHYLYRVMKDVSEIEKESLLVKIYYGRVHRSDITAMTDRIGDWIAETFGLTLSPENSKEVAV